MNKSIELLQSRLDDLQSRVISAEEMHESNVIAAVISDLKLRQRRYERQQKIDLAKAKLKSLGVTINGELYGESWLKIVVNAETVIELTDEDIL